MYPCDEISTEIFLSDLFEDVEPFVSAHLVKVAKRSVVDTFQNPEFKQFTISFVKVTAVLSTPPVHVKLRSQDQGGWSVFGQFFRHMVGRNPMPISLSRAQSSINTLLEPLTSFLRFVKGRVDLVVIPNVLGHWNLQELQLYHWGFFPLGKHHAHTSSDVRST